MRMHPPANKIFEMQVSAAAIFHEGIKLYSTSKCTNDQASQQPVNIRRFLMVAKGEVAKINI